MIKNKKISIICLIVTLFAVSKVMAQTEDQPVIFDADKLEYSDDHKMMHGFGNVIVSYEDMTMTADKVAFDVEAKEAVGEGNVTLYKDETIFRGKYGRYDFNTEKGFVSDVRIFSLPVYGGAEETEKIGEKAFIAKEGYFGTCPFKKPHYRVQGKRFEIYMEDKIVARHVIFYIGEFPFLYLPYYSYSLKENRPRVTVTPGKNKEWGFYVLSAWRYRFDDNFMGRIHFDWRENTGIAEGFTHKYKPKDFGEGTLHAYYMHERRRDIDEGLKAEDERFRIQWLHEWKPSKDSRLLLEYHRQSDEDFNKDYFYTEFAKDPRPDSKLIYTKKFPYSSLSFNTRVRVNQFETVRQQMPNVIFNMSGFQLGNSKFYYTNETSFANFNKKTANSGLSAGNSYYYTTDTHTVRADTYNKLAYATKLPKLLKWIQATPYVDVRETFYTRDKEGDKRNFFRNTYGAGYNLKTRIFRIWDIEKDLLGIKINRLRHLITPEIDYSYRHDPTVPAEKLENFDNIDSIGISKAYTFRLNNKLQTKWLEGGDNLTTINLVDFDTWFNFNPQREGRNVSDIFFSLKLMPFRWLISKSSTGYDWITRDFEMFNFSLEIEQPRWEVETTHRFMSDSYSETAFSALYHLSPKWDIGFYERYDFTKKRLNEQEYFISRDFHDWTLGLTWNIEKVEGESLMLTIKNNAFPEAPFEIESAYHEPKVGSQSEIVY